MQSSTDVGVHQPVGKTESETTLPLSSVQTTTAPYLQTSTNASSTTNVALNQASIKQVNLSARPDKPANGNSISQNNRFVPASTCVTTYHIPRGTATVANIAGPRGSLATPIVRTTPVSHVQASTTLAGSTPSAFIPALSRPVTTWVVPNTTSSAILQKAGTLNVIPSTTYVKPPSTMTVTSRIATPIASKTSDTAIKPIILQNTPKQLITQATNQLQDRNTGGMLKTNVGMVTIRGSTITPGLQPQAKVTHVAQSSQPPRLTVSTVSMPLLVPTAAAVVRKPQTLAPKIIAQSARAPFTVQSIPVSVSHTVSALTMNKKTAGITVGNNQTTVAGQNTTTMVRSTPTMVASNSMIAKVYPTNTEIRATAPTGNLLIQTTPKPSSTVMSNSTVTAFTAPSTTFMYEPENFQVKRTLVSSSCTAFTSSVTPLTTTMSIPRHFNVVSNSNPIPRLNPIMVVEPPRVAASTAPTSPNAVQPSTVTIQSYVIPQGPSVAPAPVPVPVPVPVSVPLSVPVPVPTLQPQAPSAPQSRVVSPVPQQTTSMKSNASPRPSILRKRDIDGSLAKAQRNLTPLLNSVPTSSTVPSPPPSPHMADIGGGQSSNSSSTLSATSSPGIPNIDPESPTPKPERVLMIANCDEEQLRTSSLVEMSPRKKPRKQQLGGNLTNEPKLEDDMEFISDDKIKKESRDTDPVPVNQESHKASSSSSSSSKKPNISILSGYNHGWKSRHHHFLRYNDVKYKEEKKPAVNDIANQKYVTQKINGWKIYHLSAQMENLHDIEIEVVDKFSSLLKLFKSHTENDENKSLNRTNELFMGNMQRSKVVSDQLKEAKTQMMKVFNHKKHVSDIINKYASKRTIKKKGRY